MNVRGIRGAITVSANEEQEILSATKELFLQICEQNQLAPDDIASIFITVTQDLNATFPAKVIREMPRFQYVPIMCANEIDVPGGLAYCIRLLLHVNTSRSPREIKHLFLRDAVVLRPDLAQKGSQESD